MLFESDPVVAFRIVERLTLTAVVLLVSAIVMVAFWRSVQRLDIEKAGSLGLSGSVMFSTPVFVLLTLVGYAYVSLSHPISVGPAAAPGQDRLATAGAGSSFIGMSPDSGAATAGGYDLAIAQRRIRSLNCLAADAEPSARLRDDLADTKLMLMRAVWSPDWGDEDSFADWARGIGTSDPNPAARAVFDERHALC